MQCSLKRCRQGSTQVYSRYECLLSLGRTIQRRQDTHRTTFPKVEVDGLPSIYMQDERWHSRLPCDLLRHAAQRPAFEARVATAAHDDERNVVRVGDIEDGRCHDCTRAYKRLGFDSSQTRQLSNTCKVS